MTAEKRVVPFDEAHGVGSLSEAIALAMGETYAGIEFEDPTFERGTAAVMAVLRERSVGDPQCSEIAPEDLPLSGGLRCSLLSGHGRIHAWVGKGGSISTWEVQS